MQRTRGRTRGPITRLMSPSDLGEILKPFVFLDLFDHEGAPFNGDLHPHSGIATLTYVAEGTVSYIDPDNVKAHCEWMQAGRSTKGDHVPRQTLRYVPCSATMLVFGAVRWN